MLKRRTKKDQISPKRLISPLQNIEKALNIRRYLRYWTIILLIPLNILQILLRSVPATNRQLVASIMVKRYHSFVGYSFIPKDIEANKRSL